MAEQRRLPLAYLWSEAWRNTRSGAAFAATQLLAGAITTAVLLLSVAGSARSVEQRFEQVMQHGGTSWSQFGDDRIDGRQCVAIASADGVSGAFAARDAGEVRIATLPGLPIDLVEATAGIGTVTRVLDGSTATAGVVVGAELAAEIGVAAGDAIVLVDGRQTVVAAVVGVPWPNDPLASSLISVLPSNTDGLFDRCVATASTWSGDATPLLALTLVNGSTDDKGPSKANLALGDAPDFQQLMIDTRWWIAPIGVGLAMLVIGFAAGARRALGRSAFANLGVRSADHAIIATLEVMILLPVTVVTELSVGWWVSSTLHTNALQHWFHTIALSTAATALCGALSGALCAIPLGSRARLLRRFRDRF